jgi:hypothetical protein
MTAETVAEYNVVLCVGDTTFLDYGSIAAKKEGYGPIGKGGNGLILHSALAIEAEKGQSIGLLWQKLWNREPKHKPLKDETPTQKKKRQAAARKEARNRPFEQKESYRWVEALTTVENLVSKSTRVIHAFDREGDITKKGRGQRAEGRRKEVLIKTLVVGLKPTSIKRFVARCVARDTRCPCFNPTFLNVGSLLPPASCLLPSAF